MKLAGFFVCHYSFGGGENGNTQAIEYFGQFVRGDVLAEAGAADALEGDHSGQLGGGVVFQGDFDGSLNVVVHEFVSLNIAFLVQYFGDLLLEVRGRNFHDTVVGVDGITQPGQVICYWVSHCFNLFVCTTDF